MRLKTNTLILILADLCNNEIKASFKHTLLWNSKRLLIFIVNTFKCALTGGFKSGVEIQLVVAMVLIHRKS